MSIYFVLQAPLATRIDEVKQVQFPQIIQSTLTKKVEFYKAND